MNVNGYIEISDLTVYAILKSELPIKLKLLSGFFNNKQGYSLITQYFYYTSPH